MVSEQLVNGGEKIGLPVMVVVDLLADKMRSISELRMSIRRTTLGVALAVLLALNLALSACATPPQAISPALATAESIVLPYEQSAENFRNSLEYGEEMNAVMQQSNVWNSTYSAQFSDGVSGMGPCTGVGFTHNEINYFTTAKHCTEGLDVTHITLRQPHKGDSPIEATVLAERTYLSSDVITYRLESSIGSPMFSPITPNSKGYLGSNFNISALALPIKGPLPIHNQPARNIREVVDERSPLRSGPETWYVGIDYLVPESSGTPVFNLEGELIGLFIKILNPAEVGLNGALFTPVPDFTLEGNLP
jgi:hypothetical protein